MCEVPRMKRHTVDYIETRFRVHLYVARAVHAMGPWKLPWYRRLSLCAFFRNLSSRQFTDYLNKQIDIWSLDSSSPSARMDPTTSYPWRPRVDAIQYPT